jgi:macrolide-specific efflux system membrane fusion protein
MNTKLAKGKFRLKWLVLVVLLCGSALGYFWWGYNKSPELSYKEVKATRGNLVVTILSTGVVQPENRLEIKPPIAGRIDTVLIKEGQVVKKGQLLAWMSSTERAALLDAASAKGVEELKHWEDLYRATPILAPINGTIIFRNVESGQTFSNQDSIFVMSDRLTIKAQVDETDIAQIKLKQKANVVLDAYAKQTIPAHVDQIAFDAKTVNNVTTYIVDVLPEESPAYLRSGMTANVTFFITEKSDTLLVPSEAIKTEDGKYYVLTVAENNRDKPVPKPVVVGITDGKRSEILSGINEDDVLLVARLKGKGGKSSQSNPFSPMGARPSKGH